MDKAGIGTDATMHDHIKKLLDRSYATKDANTRLSPTNLGEALVMGYDDMGYELWKPNLRSMMEQDMKEVSMGQKTKADVLSTCLQQMKACFLDARLNRAKLLEAMEIFFQRSDRSTGDDGHAAGETVRPCGLCQESNMVLRRNRDGNFMVGCCGFPQCRNAVWLPGPVLEATVTTNVCGSCTPGPVYLIQFKFRQLEIPPGFDVNHLGCIGCDETLKQLIAICGTGSRTQARGRATSTAPSNHNASNSRMGPCIYCYQTGHASTDCPRQLSSSRHVQQQNQMNGESSMSCSTCGAQCVLRTANTANNRGRKFYSCQAQACNFFVWEDSINNGNIPRNDSRSNINSGSNPSRRGGRGRGVQNGVHAAGVTFVSATGDPISGRRCFSCGDPSHFANSCPNRDR